ncbi:MAG: sigma 54-interacting transcriptional regulator [Desulfomicrobium apsheronum]|nr:sigma 54-interacting transcriptional regulator [Desulfomicrobium apsheronum]
MSTSTCSTELRVLLAISKVIDQALDLESALESILKILSDTMNMRRATITLYDPLSGRLAISTSYGLSALEKQRGVYRMDEGITGIIFRTAKPYVVPDISLEPLFLDKTGTRRISRERISFVGVPILLHGSPIGVMNVDRVFTGQEQLDADTEFLTVVATLISQFLSLNEKVKKREAALKQENTSLKYQIARENHGPYIVGKSQAMLEVEQYVAKVAITKATVLLLGESGTGKTLIGRIIHELSDRKTHPFIKVNCAAIPENLLEAELFGYERGAFTGANSTKPGRFEDAHLGTIFLDEIGELPLTLQSKLLRVLQEREFERIGSNKTRKVDVRIISATNRELEILVGQGLFREDLYYRLNVFPVHVPAVRERKEDIPRLLNHFQKEMEREYGRGLTLTTGALDLLLAYDWPGNVRELENLVERLVILTDDKPVESELVRSFLTHETHRPGPARQPSQAFTPPEQDTLCQPLKETERREVLAALKRNAWIQYKAARELNLTPRQMGYRVRKFNLEELIAKGRVEHRRQQS